MTERTERESGGRAGSGVGMLGRGLAFRLPLRLLRPLRPLRLFDRPARPNDPPNRPRPLGHRGGGRQGVAALRSKPAAALHSRQQREDRGGRGRLGADTAGLDRQDQPVRRRAGERRRAERRPGALRPGRSHVRKALLRDGHARRRSLRDRPVHPPARAGRRPARAGHPRGARRPGGRRQLLRASAGASGLGVVRPQLVVRGSGVRPGLQRQLRGLRLAARHRGRRPGGDHHVAGRGRRGLRESNGDRARGRPDRHRRSVLSRARHAQRLGRRDGRAQPASGHRVVRDARPEPVRRAGAAAGAAGDRHRDHRRHPFDDRLAPLPPGPLGGAARRDHVAAVPRLGIPDPQPEPELVRGAGAEAARAAVRARGVLVRRAWPWSAAS